MANRYKNITEQVQTFLDPVQGTTVSIVPQGTAIAEADSPLAKSRFTVLVAQNVEEQRAQQEEVKPPVHKNENPTNTDPTEAVRANDTILTDAFDGAGGRGAVNTSNANHLKDHGGVGEAAQKALEASKSDTEPNESLDSTSDTEAAQLSNQNKRQAVEDEAKESEKAKRSNRK